MVPEDVGVIHPSARVVSLQHHRSEVAQTSSCTTNRVDVSGVCFFKKKTNLIGALQAPLSHRMSPEGIPL